MTLRETMRIDDCTVTIDEAMRMCNSAVTEEESRICDCTLNVGAAVTMDDFTRL